MIKLTVIIFLILQFKFISSFDDTNDDSTVSISFEDNINDGKFSSFAKTNVRLSKQANIEISPTRGISSVQYEQLIEDTQTNPQTFYTLKVQYKRRSIQDYVMTSIPMCLILQSKFQYTINLFINENGHIASVNILTNNSTCSLSNISTIEKKNDLVYKVPLHLQFNEIGPQPEIQHFLDKIKREKEAKMHAQENDNRPFILKYWKYILPVVVIFVLQGAFTDAGSSGNGGGGR